MTLKGQVIDSVSRLMLIATIRQLFRAGKDAWCGVAVYIFSADLWVRRKSASSGDAAHQRRSAEEAIKRPNA